MAGKFLFNLFAEIDLEEVRFAMAKRGRNWNHTRAEIYKIRRSAKALRGQMFHFYRGGGELREPTLSEGLRGRDFGTIFYASTNSVGTLLAKLDICMRIFTRFLQPS